MPMKEMLCSHSTEYDSYILSTIPIEGPDGSIS